MDNVTLHFQSETDLLNFTILINAYFIDMTTTNELRVANDAEAEIELVINGFSAKVIKLPQA